MHRLLVHKAVLKGICKAKENYPINKKHIYDRNFKNSFYFIFLYLVMRCHLHHPSKLKNG